MVAHPWLGLSVLFLVMLSSVAAEAAKDAKDSGGKPPPAPRTTKEVRDRLAQHVSHFPGIQGEETTFKDALDQLSAKYGLKFEVHRAAFEAEVPPARDILTWRIARPPIPPFADRSLYSILRMVLNQAQTTSGPVFLINGNVIVITTGEALALKGLRAEPPPDARTASRAQGLRRALNRPVQFKGFARNERLTLEAVLDHLTKEFGLTFELNQTAFRTEIPPVPEVGNVPMAEKQELPAANHITLGAVLLLVLDRIPAPSGATYVLRHDCIEITTRQFVQAERTRLVVPGLSAPPPPLLP